MPKAISYHPTFKKPFPSPSRTGLSKQKLLSFYASMARIRKTEEKIRELHPEQEMRCPIHLSIGQEAVAVGVCAALGPRDWAYSGHRCHAHYLAKGGGLKEMFAELYGKASGCAKGKGGSMHLVSVENGLTGSSALVGGTIPIATGSAMAFKFEKSKQVAVSFFGDAGVEEGVFYESYLYAALRRLPVIFVCENNFYATNTPFHERQVPGKISKRVQGLGGLTLLADGNNVLDVYRAAAGAVAQARLGHGPVFLECWTYRWYEHCGMNFDYQMGYRTKEEVDQWIKRCPVTLYKNWLIKSKIAAPRQLDDIDAALDQEIREAVAFAKSAPFPKSEELLSDVYG